MSMIEPDPIPFPEIQGDQSVLGHSLQPVQLSAMHANIIRNVLRPLNTDRIPDSFFTYDIIDDTDLSRTPSNIEIGPGINGYSHEHNGLRFAHVVLSGIQDNAAYLGVSTERMVQFVTMNETAHKAQTSLVDLPSKDAQIVAEAASAAGFPDIAFLSNYNRFLFLDQKNSDYQATLDEFNASLNETFNHLFSDTVSEAEFSLQLRSYINANWDGGEKSFRDLLEEFYEAAMPSDTGVTFATFMEEASSRFKTRLLSSSDDILSAAVK